MLGFLLKAWVLRCILWAGRILIRIGALAVVMGRICILMRLLMLLALVWLLIGRLAFIVRVRGSGLVLFRLRRDPWIRRLLTS